VCFELSISGQKGWVTVMAVLTLAARLVPSVILLLAGLSKVLNFQWFVKSITAHRIVPESAASSTAMVVVAAELIAGTCLGLGVFQPYAGRLATGLFVTFAAVIIANQFRGMTEQDCGCVKTSCTVRTTWRAAARSLALAALTILHTDGAAIAPLFAMTVFATSLGLMATTIGLDLTAVPPEQVTTAGAR
jgi:uncharacterized membrane protein YphA (DoxX/SURF4 family)